MRDEYIPSEAEQINLSSYLSDIDLDVGDSANVAESDTQTATKFSLPIVMYTYRFLELCNDHKLGRVPILLALIMLGNMDSRRGFIFRFKIESKASDLGCTSQQLYKAVRELRDVGFGNFSLRYGMVSGRLFGDMLFRRILYQYEESGEITVEDLNGHAMPVGMLHHCQIETHIASSTSGAHLRLMLALCLNVNVHTGELSEKRPEEWAALSNCHRTWVSEGIDHANEIGVIQTKTDYYVRGHLPFVALSNGYFQYIKLAKEEGRHSKDVVKEKLTALYECFGIQLKGLSHDIIENAWRLLGSDADKIREASLKKLSTLLDREAPLSERRRVVESAARDKIPMREELPFA